MLADIIAPGAVVIVLVLACTALAEAIGILENKIKELKEKKKMEEKEKKFVCELHLKVGREGTEKTAGSTTGVWYNAEASCRFDGSPMDAYYTLAQAAKSLKISAAELAIFSEVFIDILRQVEQQGD